MVARDAMPDGARHCQSVPASARVVARYALIGRYTSFRAKAADGVSDGLGVVVQGVLDA